MSSSGEKSSSPIALIPSRQARPRRTWCSNAASRPPSSSRPSATSRPCTSETAGVKAASKICLRLARPLPVEVEARQRPARVPGALRDGDEREAGRRHQRLLRAGDDDVDAPLVGLERHGAEARDGVDDESAPASLAAAASAADVGDDAGRGLGVRQQDDPRLALGQPRREVVRRRRSRPTRRRAGRPRSRTRRRSTPSGRRTRRR